MQSASRAIGPASRCKAALNMNQNEWRFTARLDSQMLKLTGMHILKVASELIWKAQKICYKKEQRWVLSLIGRHYYSVCQRLLRLPGAHHKGYWGREQWLYFLGQLCCQNLLRLEYGTLWHTITFCRATSHASQEPWPWNCESPKEKCPKAVPRHLQNHVGVVTDPQV
jgi:hypothetical protein